MVTVNENAYVFGGERITFGAEIGANGLDSLSNDVHELSFSNNVLRCTEMKCFPEADDPAADTSAIPCERCWHTGTCIKYTTAENKPKDDGVLILGGKDSTGKILADAWLLLLEKVQHPPHPGSSLPGEDKPAHHSVKPRWLQLSPSGTSPLPLAYHSAVAWNDGSQVVVIGGKQSMVPGPFLESVHVLDLTTNAWSTLALSPPPSENSKALTARCCFTALAMVLPMEEPNGKIMHFTDDIPPEELDEKDKQHAREAIVIYGGFSELDPAIPTSSCVLLDAACSSIREILTPNAGLTSYMGHACVSTADKKSLYVFGGINPTTNQFIDTTSALHFWRPQPLLPDGTNDSDDPNASPIQTKHYEHGDVYVGEMDIQHAIRHGRGKCTYRNGDVYEGEWTDDQRSGQGTMAYSNEDVYAGEWACDQRHGFGILQHHIRENQSKQRVEVKHEGRWQNDDRCGSGTTSYSDGSRLVAAWGVGGRVDFGRLEHYDDGNGVCSYEGEVVNGVPHGEGTSEHPGETYAGHWHSGRRSGHGVATLFDGTTYRGDWRNGKRNGFGTCEYARTRDRYTGKWVGGVRCGRGECTYANGCVYSGDWKDDKCHGLGRYTFTDGTFYEGDWKGNDFCGDGALVLDLDEAQQELE